MDPSASAQAPGRLRAHADGERLVVELPGLRRLLAAGCPGILAIPVLLILALPRLVERAARDPRSARRLGRGLGVLLVSLAVLLLTLVMPWLYARFVALDPARRPDWGALALVAGAALAFIPPRPPILLGLAALLCAVALAWRGRGAALAIHTARIEIRGRERQIFDLEGIRGLARRAGWRERAWIDGASVPALRGLRAEERAWLRDLVLAHAQRRREPLARGGHDLRQAPVPPPELTMIASKR